MSDLKSTSSIGSTTYHDLSSGAKHTVPWGGADWLFFAVITVIGLSFAAGVATAAVRFVIMTD